jgi:hypothetical protein
MRAVGLAHSDQSVEDWPGTVLTRPSAGYCESPELAATAVRLMCEEFGLQINLAAE